MDSSSNSETDGILSTFSIVMVVLSLAALALAYLAFNQVGVPVP
jgi:hypothetical protein